MNKQNTRKGRLGRIARQQRAGEQRQPAQRWDGKRRMWVKL